MKHYLLFLVCLFLLQLFPVITTASNIAVGNVSLVDKNTTEKYIKVQFDLSWDNSWRTSTGACNWDAAWVFVKYSKDDGATWHHAYLNKKGHLATGRSMLKTGLLNVSSVFDKTANPGLGAFIYRREDGEGTFSMTGLKLRWNYGVNGVSNGDAVEVKVFAIEMVYVPEGAFFLGSGGNEANHFYKYPTTTDAYKVSTEDSIQIGTAAGDLYYIAGTNAGDQTGLVPPSFPKGYAGFYCMKYEITQGGYADFLNTLTSTQDGQRYHSTTGYRYTIGGSAGNRNAASPYRACNYLSWMDGVAYADWSGLRPMTELEFEKACRGTAEPVANEYAWGTTTIITATTSLSNDGTATETPNQGNCNCKSCSPDGPYRAGCYYDMGNTREARGTTYYGILDMSGSLWGRSVTIGNSTGRQFTGSNGNGSLSTSGNATNRDWPGYVSGEITGATGAGFRGGTWYEYAPFARISDRGYVAFTYTSWHSAYGFRAVRSVSGTVDGGFGVWF